jgi:hypothetical protein
MVTSSPEWARFHCWTACEIAGSEAGIASEMGPVVRSWALTALLAVAVQPASSAVTATAAIAELAVPRARLCIEYLAHALVLQSPVAVTTNGAMAGPAD